METDPVRLAAMAKDYGVRVVAGQAVAVTQVAIADVYLRELDAETRRAMRAMRERRDD
jgi:hypothetical protein